MEKKKVITSRDLMMMEILEARHRNEPELVDDLHLIRRPADFGLVDYPSSEAEDIDTETAEEYILTDSDEETNKGSESGSRAPRSQSKSNNVEESASVIAEGTLPLKKRRKISEKEAIKECRIRGDAFVSHKGKQQAPRPMLQAPCASNEDHRCITMVPDQIRRSIYEAYRNLSTIHDQRVFISQHIIREPKKRSTVKGPSRRTFSRRYSLTVDGEQKNVCRRFFMATLNVSDAFMRSAETDKNGILEEDKRGKHAPKHKLNDSELNFIKSFIESFPVMESHYCRKTTSKKYLDPSLNISIMYRMYSRRCSEENRQKVSFEKFRQVFRTYNVGFFRPKKDQCNLCLSYVNGSDEQKEMLNEKYQQHILRKEAARQCRDDDKQLAINEPSVLSINFDLQAVLCTPKGPAGQIFYLRKLAVYNFTIFDLRSHDGHCFLWDETQGNRGANEIATCIFKYVTTILENSPQLKDLRMMSDSCGGQNKNSIVAAMCLYLLKTTVLESVRLSFFEPGHSEMECDSIHSKIERKSKNVPVYSLEGWAQIIRCARVNPRPFVVTQLKHPDFKNFASHSEPLKKIVPWKKICSILLTKTEDGSAEIKYKLKYEDEYITAQPSGKKTRGRPKNFNTNFTVQKAYPNSLKISTAKYNDLKKMCTDLTIPSEYHEFYLGLKHGNDLADRHPLSHHDDSTSCTTSDEE